MNIRRSVYIALADFCVFLTLLPVVSKIHPHMIRMKLFVESDLTISWIVL